MKLFIKRVFSFLLAFMLFAPVLVTFVGCSGEDDDDDDETPPVSLQDKIKAGGVVDLSKEAIPTGGLEIKDTAKPLTLKGGDFAGKTLTIVCDNDSSNITIDGAKNIKIVIKDATPQGTTGTQGTQALNATIKNITGSESEVCLDTNASSVAVEINSSTIKTMQVQKQATVTLQGTTIQDADLKAPVSISLDGTSQIASSLSVDSSVAQDVTLCVSEGTVIKNASCKSGDTTTDTKIKVTTATPTLDLDTVFKDAQGASCATTVAQKITVVSVSLTGEAAKTAYKKQEVQEGLFDYTGLKAHITYSDDTTKDVPLSSINCTLTGFNLDAAQGDATITYNTYKEQTTATKTVSYTISDFTQDDGAKAQNVKTLIQEAIAALNAKDYDMATAKIKTAYDIQKTNETKAYYALSQIALISTDPSTKNLMQKYLGIQDYPATLNALFSASWLENYKKTGKFRVAHLTQDDAGRYIRCDITKSLKKEDSREGYFMDDTGTWFGCWRDDVIVASSAAPCATGKYMFDIHRFADLIGGWLSYDYTNNKWVMYGPNGLPYDIPSNCIYDHGYSQQYEEEERVVVIEDYNLPSVEQKTTWLSGTDAYKEGLFNGTQTTTTLALTLIANALEVNKTGANALIDDMLNCVTKRLDLIKDIPESIQEASVQISDETLHAFGLEQILGEGPVLVGKAEINAVVAAMQVIQGTLQWLSGYDLSFNTDMFQDLFHDKATFGEKNRFGKWSSQEVITAIQNTVIANTLKQRNASRITLAKTTFVDAFEKLGQSYDCIINADNGLYPQGVKDKIKEYGKNLRVALNLLVSAINSSSPFYLPKNPIDTTLTSWPVSSGQDVFGVNMKEFFSSGALSNLIEKNAADSFQLYGSFRVAGEKYSYSGGNYRYGNIDIKMPYTKITSADEYIKYIKSKFSNEVSGWDSVHIDKNKIQLAIKVSSAGFQKLLPGADVCFTSYFEKDQAGDIYVPVYLLDMHEYELLDE